MNSYRGFEYKDICHLVSSGQAKALNHGSGVLGAFNWIDAYHDIHKSKNIVNFHPKPGNETYMKILMNISDMYEEFDNKNI
jgi:hypothetical protein